ncbi:uncharacterized protein LOC119615721 [Lucilia sericata]|uniref:uncharacterized protein LOC119615721 n=1 Tax=Lucilia sericata TaxID=13632 RepID=UPI0018A8121A|nr:uncharacterized protein LOC119615721 [Lucilia sericata]
MKMSPKKREDVVENHGYCINCLAKSHTIRACQSMDTCRICYSYHHTLLHPHRQRVRHQQQQGQRQQSNRQQSNRQQQRQQPDSRDNQEQGSQQITQSAITPTKSTTPDVKILVEAIRSLAHVLCAQEGPILA